MATATKRKARDVTKSEIVAQLKRVGCQFWACDGWGRPPRDMKTCHVCRTIYGLEHGGRLIDEEED